MRIADDISTFTAKAQTHATPTLDSPDEKQKVIRIREMFANGVPVEAIAKGIYGDGSECDLGGNVYPHIRERVERQRLAGISRVREVLGLSGEEKREARP